MVFKFSNQVPFPSESNTETDEREMHPLTQAAKNSMKFPIPPPAPLEGLISRHKSGIIYQVILLELTSRSGRGKRINDERLNVTIKTMCNHRRFPFRPPFPRGTNKRVFCMGDDHT